MGKSGVGCALEPVRRLGQVLGPALTLRIAERDYLLRPRVAVRCGLAQRQRAVRFAS